MFETRLRKRPKIEIIPMVDVIFFLLVFFMLFTTFKTTPSGLDIQLPRAITAAVTEQQNIALFVSEDGDFYLENEQMDRLELRTAINSLQEEYPHLVVIIKADRSTPYNHIVNAMDVLRESGVFRIAFGAEPHRGD